MLKYVLIFVTVFSFGAFAQELHDETIDFEIPAPVDEPRDVLYLPACDDVVMMEQIKDRIRLYQDQHPVSGIINARKRDLLTKNLKHFDELSIKEFDNKTSYNVASEIVTTKINRQISEDEMRLCIDNNKVMYLLIYPEGEQGFRVQIINFIARDTSGNKFSILYIPHDEKIISSHGTDE